MKKVLMLMMCVLLALAALGCGQSAKQESKPAEKVLKVATDANFPPFEYYQEKTKVHTGFDIGLMNALAKEMGYTRVEYVNVDFKDILKGLQEKKYDAAIAGMTISPERQQNVDFTEPYVQDGYKIAVATAYTGADGLAALQGKRVAVENESFALELVQKAGNAAEIITVGSTEEALQQVAAGKADCLIASTVATQFFIANGYGDRIKFAGDEVLYQDDIGIAVTKGNTELLQKFNAALSELRRSGEYKRIYGSYFGN